MATHNTDSKTDSRTDRHGLMPNVVHLALDVADRGQSTAISVLNDARVELRAAMENGIELAEKLATGAFRFARKLTQRIDEASGEALTGAERALSNAVKTARETTLAAQHLAATATSQVTGRQAQA
ncbi:MAG: hypothetical protein H6Q90_5159 [Deltaproteobacteria bacterium]|nr:hypothetical protein [Deltaproteobacteria bacterium]